MRNQSVPTRPTPCGWKETPQGGVWRSWEGVGRRRRGVPVPPAGLRETGGGGGGKGIPMCQAYRPPAQFYTQPQTAPSPLPPALKQPPPPLGPNDFPRLRTPIPPPFPLQLLGVDLPPPLPKPIDCVHIRSIRVGEGAAVTGDTFGLATPGHVEGG